MNIAIRRAYDDLFMWRSIVKEIIEQNGPLDTRQAEVLKRREDEYKRKIRRLNHEEDDGWRCYYGRDDYESRYKMYKLPFLMTKDETNEYIEEEWWSICSPYDCTGKFFTISINCIPIPELNQTIVIHQQCLDV